MDVKKIEKCEKLTQICINMLELLRLYKILKIKKKHLRRWWVKPHLYPNMRDMYSAYFTVFAYFKLNDEEEFYQFTRMKIYQFNELYTLLERKLARHPFAVRRALRPELCLAVALQ